MKRRVKAWVYSVWSLTTFTFKNVTWIFRKCEMENQEVVILAQMAKLQSNRIQTVK